MRERTHRVRRLAGILAASVFVTNLAFAHAGADVRFQAPVLWQIGHGAPARFRECWELAFGDLDRDGRVDIVAPLLDSVAVYLGDGDGTFDVPLRFPLPGRTDHPTVADFDGDGALDIAWGGSHQVGVLFGDGTGRNWTRTTRETSDDWSAVLAGDFDGDGRKDLASTSIDASGTHWIRSYLSRPGRTFERHSEAQPAAWPKPPSFRVCDVNEDHLTDFVIGGSDAATVWVSDGDGTFTRTASIPALTWGLDVGDIDGDGHADVVIADHGSNFTIAMGRGDGTFGAPQFQPAGSVTTSTVAIGDLN